MGIIFISIIYQRRESRQFRYRVDLHNIVNDIEVERYGNISISGIIRQIMNSLLYNIIELIITLYYSTKSYIFSVINKTIELYDVDINAIKEIKFFQLL